MRAGASDLTEAIAGRCQSAMASGALQPIATEQIALHDGPFPFVVKWIAHCNPAPPQKPARGGAHNPFLPPEPALTLGPLPPAHLALLNKYPVMDHHLLIVTRQFEAQTDALCAGDFAALAAVMRDHGGLGFYNGGEVAGASQPHKHLQWIPEAPPIARALPTLLARSDVDFGFRHAFMPLDTRDWSAEDDGEALAAHYRRALAQLRIDPAQAPLAPYNLLLSREWMWLIPRRAERWSGMSINALGFAGSLFIRARDDLPALQTAGPLNALRAVAVPT